ncbi:MAG: hypothetical protein HY724_09565 [Candidatus Rokubacteria bacterium]|nr:hypothetical protein [Candidatus Rokubacteria bacterium]
MKRERRRRVDEDMREEYDVSGGVRGKYTQRYAEGTNVVVLDPDVAAVLPDRESVNQALRAVAQIIKTHAGKAGDSNPNFTCQQSTERRSSLAPRSSLET